MAMRSCFQPTYQILRYWKSQHKPRDVVLLVNIFNCPPYDWTAIHVYMVIGHDPIRDVVRTVEFSHREVYKDIAIARTI